MTGALTRLKVNAKKGIILKDRAAALEIALLTGRHLPGAEPAEPGLAANGYMAHPLSTPLS